MVVWQLVATFLDPSSGLAVEKRSREVYCSEDEAMKHSGRFNYLVREINEFGDYYPVEVRVKPLVIE